MKIKKLFLLLLLLAAACSSGPGREEDKPLVMVSILPQQYLVKELAGDLLDVQVMIPSGASPATYEPTVRQLLSLESSALYFKAGYLGFERSSMERIASHNPDMRIIDLSDGISMIAAHHDHSHAEEHEHGHSHGGIDPHIWMSARNMKTMASTAGKALCELLPEDSVRIIRNLDRFHLKCDSMDMRISSRLKGLTKRTFLVYHPSLAYFARDYGLEQMALEFEGKTPSPAQAKKLADTGKALGIKNIFIQRQFDKDHAVVLAGEIGAEVVQIDPLDPDWPGQMFHITDMLSKSAR